MRQLTLTAFKKSCDERGFSKYIYCSLESNPDGAPYMDLDLIFDSLVVCLQPNVVALCKDGSYVSFNGVKRVLMEDENTYYLVCQYNGEANSMSFKIRCEK